MVIIFSRLLEYLLLRLYGLFSGLDLACISDCRFIPSSSSVLSGFIFGLLGFLVTYLIWSLIQKKEIVEIQKKGTDDNIKEAQQ